MDSDLNNKLKLLEINDVNSSEDKVSMGMKGSKRAKKNVLVLEDEAQPNMTKTVGSMLPVPNTEFVEQYSHVAGCSNEKPLIVYQGVSVTDCDKISVVSQSSQKENGISNQNLDTALILEERISYNSKETKSDTSVNVDTNHGLCIISALVEDDNRNVLGNDTKLEDNTHKDPNNRQKANDQKSLGEANQEDNDCQQDSKLVAKSCPELETKTYSFLSNQNVSVKEIQDTGACRENVNKEKKNTFYAIHSLEKALMAMNAENKDWNQSVIDLSKCTRTTYKTHPKEVVTVLVKHQLVDKFITFIKVNNVEFLAKLKPNEIDSMKCWPSFKRILNLFWILCDSSVNFCQYTLNSKVFEYLMMELRVLSAVSHSLNERSLYLLKAILGLFHNITRHIPSSKWVFRNEGLVSILRIFLSCDEAMVRVKALIILSYITSETENEIINSDDENFQFIILVLNDSLSSANHTSLKYGMNSLEVLKGLCNLAVNDENKIRIVKNGVLPLYEHCLEVGNKEEKKLVITSLWSLAFHHYNKQKMRDSKGLMQKLRALESPVEFADDDEICHAARGAVWELENVSAASIDRNYSSSTEKDSQLPHIMISYQWDSQSIMVKVKDKLRQAGYKVWMDVEHMTGSTLEAMALAVERAAVVLICMSQKYKDSPNCRTGEHSNWLNILVFFPLCI